MIKQQVSGKAKRISSGRSTRWIMYYSTGILGIMSVRLATRARAFSTTTMPSVGSVISARYRSALAVAGKEVEQDVQTNPSTTTSSNSSHENKSVRFDNLLESVGLAGKLTHAKDLPEQRTVTPHDVFCNRELKMSGIRAIGFDMDYTLAQYQQPAFDKLAFDGAKEKLVYKLGYPKEVLDFEYDHEVCFMLKMFCLCACVLSDATVLN